MECLLVLFLGLILLGVAQALLGIGGAVLELLWAVLLEILRGCGHVLRWSGRKLGQLVRWELHQPRDAAIGAVMGGLVGVTSYFFLVDRTWDHWELLLIMVISGLVLGSLSYRLLRQYCFRPHQTDHL